jgi:hypothetical protein
MPNNVENHCNKKAITYLIQIKDFPGLSTSNIKHYISENLHIQKEQINMSTVKSDIIRYIENPKGPTNQSGIP